MKNALILNNTHSEAEFINILKRNYKAVFTLGKKKPYNKDLQIKHIKCDYKNHKRIRIIKRQYNISDIFPGANDLTLFSLANLRSKFIDNLSIIKLLHNKKLFRNFNKDIKIYTINSLKQKINTNKINYPLLAKPELGHGGKGIIKIENQKDLQFFLKEKKNQYIVEEFIEGTNHGIFTLIKNHNIIFTFFDTEQRFINPYTVSSTISHCYLNNIIKDRIKKKLLEIIKKLKLKDGIFHVQIIFNKKKKKFHIIEITRRLPGDNYLKFIKYSTGLSMEEYILKLFLKKKFKIKPKKNNFILRKILMSSANGYFDSLKISKKIINNIIENQIFFNKKKKIKNYLQDRVGVIFFKFKTKKQLLIITKNIDKYVSVITK